MSSTWQSNVVRASTIKAVSVPAWQLPDVYVDYNQARSGPFPAWHSNNT